MEEIAYENRKQIPRFTWPHLPIQGNFDLAAVKSFKADVSSVSASSSLWLRDDARNVSFKTLYGGQITFSTQSIKPNYLILKFSLSFYTPPLTQQHRFFKILPSLNIQGLEASMHKLSTPTHICEQNSIGKNPLKNRWSNMFKCSRVSVRNMNYGTTSHSWQFTCTF